MSAIEYFSDGELSTVLFHYWADLITRKVFLRSSYNEHPCNLSLDLTFGAFGTLSLFGGYLGRTHQGGEKKAGERANAVIGWDLQEEAEAKGRIRVGVGLDLLEAVGTRGATGGETETERGHWGRRIFYQQNSRTASGWSLETSSSGA